MEILERIGEFKRKIVAGGGDYSTAKTYGNCMSLMLQHYSEKYASPDHITLRDMEDYIIHLIDTHSSSYINQFIASAKRFYKINGQPKKCDALIYHNREIKTPNILTHSECMAMCESKQFIKHRAIINLLYYGALRRSELLNLKIEHISRDRRIVIVDSKYGKSRTITIPQETLDLLREYFKQIRPKQFLFNGEGGRLQYSAKSLENVVKNTAKHCSISKKVNPHLMRSSRATHLLDGGASDMYVSEFLGHAKLQTTKDYYCKLTIKGMQDNFDVTDEKLIKNNINNKIQDHLQQNETLQKNEKEIIINGISYSLIKNVIH